LNQRLDDPLTSELPSLVLVLPSNCGSRILTLRDGGQALAASSPEGARPRSLSRLWLSAVGVEAQRQGRLEPDQVRSALWVLMLFENVKMLSL